MIRARTSSLVLAGMLAFATAASTARAQNGTALSLFNEGRNLANQGRYEEACDRFARSDAIERTVGTLLNLGDCNERLQRFASAWVADSRAEELAQRLKDPRVKDAHDAAAHVAPRIARLVITIDATYPGLSITRNESKVEAAEYNAAIPVDPGPQTIIVTATGRQPWQTHVRLGEGESQTVRVPALEPSPSVVVETPPPSPGAEPGSSRTGVAIGLEIGGGVVIVGGLVFGALAIGTWASVTAACPNARCANEAVRAQHDGDVHTASTLATVSTIAVAVGGAALVTGVVLHLTAPGKSVAIAPTFDRAGGGLVATLRL